MCYQDDVRIGRHNLAVELSAQARRHHGVSQIGVDVDDELTIRSLDAQPIACLTEPLKHVRR